MIDFDKSMQLLIIAKLVALEKTLQQHSPDVYQDYLASLKTLIEEQLLDTPLILHPRLLEELKKHFDL